MNWKKFNGFSLMEMMVVLLIVAIVLAASAPMISRKMVSGAGDTGCRWDLLSNGTGIAYNPNGNNGNNNNKTVFIGTTYLPWNINGMNGIDMGQPKLVIGSNSIKSPHITLSGNSGGLGDTEASKVSIMVSPRNNGFAIRQALSDGGNNNNRAIGRRALSIGMGSAATGDDGSIALGLNAVSLGKHAIAIGSTEDDADNGGSSTNTNVPEQHEGTQPPLSSYNYGDYTLAKLVQNAKNKLKSTLNDISNGYGMTAYATNASQYGDQNNTYQLDPIFNSNHTRASGRASIAIGMMAKSADNHTIALGSNATVVNNDNPVEDAIAIGHNAIASRVIATAVGPNAKARNIVTSAFGSNSTADGAYSSAIGITTQATGTCSFASGIFAQAFGDRSLAVGAGNSSSTTVANEIDTIAIGSDTKAYGKESIAIGREAVAGVRSNDNISDCVAIGKEALATGDMTTAVGYQANARAASATAYGHAAKAYGSESLAVGREAEAGVLNNTSISDGVAVGYNSRATGDMATAVGYQAIATAANTTAYGHDAQATVDSATAIGRESRATAQNATAVGRGAQATATLAAAFGDGAQATKSSACAFGVMARAYGQTSIAIGNGSQALPDASSAIAIGFMTVARNTNSIAIGNRAHALNTNSIAIGNGASAEKDNYIELGNKNRTHTVHIPGNLIVDGTITTTGGLTVNGGHNSDDKVEIIPTPLSGTYFCDVKLYNGNIRTPSIYLQNGNSSGFAKWLSSDRRLKNVGDIYKAGLNELKKLDFYHYTFKDDKTKTPRVGVMAQDLQKIFPDAVVKGEDGFLRIRLEDMFYAVINAVKELDAKVTAISEQVKSTVDLTAKLQAKIDSQQKEIAILKKKNAEFEKRLKNLENKMK